MKAVAVNPQEKQSVNLVDFPMPQIGQSEVLIRTLSVGIDGTDIEINKGQYGRAPDNENILILGHEAVGRVEAVGSRVKEIKTGDTVVPTVRRGCLSCPSCQDDRQEACQSEDHRERGIKQAHGYLAEFFKEDPKYLVKIPADIVAHGVLIEPLSIVQKAIEQAFLIQRRTRKKPGIALVLGAGPLGLLATMITRSKGLRVFTYDLAHADSPKASVARMTGAEYIDAGKISLDSFLSHFAAPDLIIEATGNSQVAFSVINILNAYGVMCLLSVAPRDHGDKICLGCLNNFLVLGNRAVFGSVSSNKRHFEQAIETAKYAEEKWSGILSAVITEEFGLPDYQKAFDGFGAGHIKSLVRLENFPGLS